MSTATSGNTCVPFDHITLDLRNDETHITGFDSLGERRRHFLCDALGVPSETGARQWFIFSVRRTVLDQQCGSFEWTARMPKSDEDRREDEFRKYAQHVL